MLITIFGVLATLLAISVVIFAHEWGHFWAARKAGVGVLEFSVGMGPVILKKTLLDTPFCFRLFPIGGFVKLAGMDDESEPVDPKLDFYKKTIFQRFITLAAGSFMNLVVGFLVFLLLFLTVGKLEVSTVIDSVMPNSPAQRANLQVGDTIVALNQNPVNEGKAFMKVVSGSLGVPLQVSVLRNGQVFQTVVTPQAIDSKKGKIGVVFQPVQKRVGPVKAVVEAIKLTQFHIGWVFKSIGMLISGEASMKDMAGPVGIIQLASFGLSQGVSQFLSIIGMISISLGVVNLFPFPVLDGGHILFLGIEAIRGKRLSAKWEAALNNIGVAVLVTLMAFVVINDVVHLKERINLFKGMMR